MTTPATKTTGAPGTAATTGVTGGATGKTAPAPNLMPIPFRAPEPEVPTMLPNEYARSTEDARVLMARAVQAARRYQQTVAALEPDFPKEYLHAKEQKARAEALPAIEECQRWLEAEAEFVLSTQGPRWADPVMHRQAALSTEPGKILLMRELTDAETVVYAEMAKARGDLSVLGVAYLEHQRRASTMTPELRSRLETALQNVEWPERALAAARSKELLDVALDGLAGETYKQHFQALVPDAPDRAAKKLTLARAVRSFRLG